jgi:hypothetical protein
MDLILDGKRIAERANIRQVCTHLVRQLLPAEHTELVLSEEQLDRVIEWVTCKWQEFRLEARCTEESAIGDEFVEWAVTSKTGVNLDAFYAVCSAALPAAS